MKQLLNLKKKFSDLKGVNLPEGIRISVFDLDDTLFNGNSSFQYYLYLCRLGLFPCSTFLSASVFLFRYQFLGLPPSELHQLVFSKLLKGKSMKTISQPVTDFWDKRFHDSFYVPAISTLRRCQEKGHYVLLLSSSPEFLVGPIAKELEVDEYKASGYDLDKKGELTSISTNVDGSFDRIG